MIHSVQHFGRQKGLWKLVYILVDTYSKAKAAITATIITSVCPWQLYRQSTDRQTDEAKEWAQLHVFQCMMKDVKMVEMEGPPRSHIHLVQSSWQALDFITLGTWPSSSVHNTVRIVINSVEECIDIGSLGIGTSGFLRQEFHLIV